MGEGGSAADLDGARPVVGGVGETERVPEQTRSVSERTTEPTGGRSPRQGGRTLRCPEPLDPAITLSPLRRGTADPVHRVTPDGAVWRGVRTTTGPCAYRITVDASGGEISIHAWGSGYAEVLERFPSLIGADDDRTGFEPGVTVLDRLARRFAGWRVCRTRQVWEALFPAVLEQKVTSTEAWRSWRELVRRFGDRAPAPDDGPALWVPPGPEVVRALPSWEWHRAGVGPDRMRTLVRCARVANRLQESLELTPAEADARLRVVPGVGGWTSAEVRQRAHGDPDAVSVGDYNLPKAVGWVLAGRRFDDEAMLAALERWRGHRYRVTKLIELSGSRPPRRGPRLPPRDYRSF